MKRKQATLQGFFQSPASVDNKQQKLPSDAVIDLTQTSNNTTNPPPNAASPSVSSTSHLPNAFSKLLAGSKAVNKKNRALFTLDLMHNNQLLPNFTFDYDHQSISLQDCWHCEVHVSHFRWSMDEKIHKDVTLTLRSNILPPNYQPNATTSSPSKVKPQPSSSATGASKSVINNSLLKSMIQKGVRRRQTAKVLRLSHELCKHNLQDFIRRLAVISVEDAVLHPAIPIVVWLMIATSKGYEVPNFLQDICLSIVGDLTRAEVRDSYVPSSFSDYDELIQNNSNGLPELSRVVIKDIDRNEIFDLLLNGASRTLVASLLLRRAYGGMGGDMEMLEGYAILWAKRLSYYDPTKIFDVERTQATSLSSDGSVEKMNAIEKYLYRDFLRQLFVSGWKVDNAHWGNHLLSSFYCRSLSPSSPSTTSLISNSASIIDQMLLESNSSHSIATLTAEDLISEGLDFHCDWSMIDHINNVNQAELDQYFTTELHNPSTNDMEYRQGLIKKAIWEFRSSSNHHKLWACYPIEKQEYDSHLLTSLNEKQQMTKLWKIICPTITAYCNSKMNVIARQLKPA